MQRNALLFAILFAVAALPLGAAAAADKPAETQAAAAARPAKPHSHVEEKTGVPQKAPVQDAGRQNAAKDKTKHFHPRDMK